MTLNLIEAAAVNRVIEHLAGAFPGAVHTGRSLPDRAQAVLALATLADAAYRRLSAGYSGENALQALEARWPGALREIWMLEMHGGEPEPWAGDLPARQHALREGAWDPGTDLAWRTGRTDAAGSAKILYANGVPTLCTLWPAVIRGLDQAAEGTEGSSGARLDSAGERGAACWPPVGGHGLGAPDESVAACKACGCTEDEPCEGGCARVTGSSLEIDLCTACAWTIARDAIASGLYQLESTVGDTLVEARGGLIPQPMLTEQEIEELQPLIEAVDAAAGDPATLDALARTTAAAQRLAGRRRVFDLEWSVRAGGLLGPVTSEAEARSYVADQRKLYPGDIDENTVQCRLVGAWFDADLLETPHTGPATAPAASPAATPADEQPPTPSQLTWDLAQQWTRGRGATGLAPHVIRLYDDTGLLDPDKVSQHVQIAHPAECRALPPGARCWFDGWDRQGRAIWLLENGIYRIHLEDVVDGGDEDGPNIVEHCVCERYDESTRTWNDYQEPDGAPAAATEPQQ
ncbi:hypothetical protein KGA66_06130 [Actinocrinis puniceicyclus]|uniref:Uncharacterized protein n=1 Tax=Actinocrinis puniceicyclus TaxID=977794 RepID=A0A8J8BA64_9ACTN|nr:hypothetical protein [Actinocrinis puniceicyclus]MBS2962617.1 hypothetical protein [Actinocrinis puniceicyclus]